MKHSVISNACWSVEFLARFLLVNIPSYILANYPEFDRISNIIYAYLTFQVAGFCWGFLINALFALACRIVSFLPPDVLSALQDSASSSSTISYNSFQSVAIFYVAYASIRVVVGFGQSIFHLALESIRDFPEAAMFFANGGVHTLQMYPIIFLPPLALQIAFMSADRLCDETGNTLVTTAANTICRLTGTYYLSSSYPEVRRIVLYALIVMTFQIWQCFLHEFPRFDKALKKLSTLTRVAFQLSLIVLVVASLTITAYVLSQPASDSAAVLRQPYIVFVIFGWTMWLFWFSPFLFQEHGLNWAAAVSRQSVESLAAYVRISQVIGLFMIFTLVCYRSGFLAAQLDLTIITVILPALYCCIYILACAMMRSNSSMVLLFIALAVCGSYVTTHIAQSGGKGGALLVFVHMLYKLLQVFGKEPSTHNNRVRGGSSDWEAPGEEDFSVLRAAGSPLVRSKSNKGEVEPNISNASDISTGPTSISPSPLDKRKSAAKKSSELSPLPHGLLQRTKSLHVMSTPDRKSEVIQLPRRHSGTDLGAITAGDGWFRSANIEAEKLLAQRGGDFSTHVSLGLSASLRKHWLVRLSRRYLRFIISLVRKVTVSSSVLVGVARIFVLIAVSLTITLAAISVASHVQTSWNVFPRLIDFHVDPQSGALQFDHRIVNVTLFPMKSSNTSMNVNSIQCAKAASQFETKEPFYAACGWNLEGVSLLDFSLFSELAYFDDPGDDTLQSTVDHLFPQFDFQVTHRRKMDRTAGASPMYLEVHSQRLNLTVISIRGTDVGRLQDLMEDVKLYAEPVIFTLLSSVFPTIRWWSQETTSKVIEWLCEFNTFFGLQGESEYYRPLTQRVLELSTSHAASRVVLTGHSLGGGLARIVGTLTAQPTVTFSPPGLALSYRKYSAIDSQGNAVKVANRGAVHHKSMAVITEYDWITQVDHQVGLVQRIVCDQDDKAHQNACHLLEGTICHLLEHCGDVHGRFAACDYRYDLTVAIPSLLRFVQQHKWILLPPVALFLLMVALAVIPELL